MWCTRWYLPLLLLPLPTAQPYFLLLFLLTLGLYSKPWFVGSTAVFASLTVFLSFYCIVLLSTLFVSSCYWQPIPLNSRLSVPWAENITTFSEALNASLRQPYSKPLPSVMRSVDRCWCDLSAGSFFEPFNVTRWEYLSVQKLKTELERRQSQNQTGKANVKILSNSSGTSDMPRTAMPENTSGTSLFGGFLSRNMAHNKPEAGIPHLESRDTSHEFSLKPFGLDITIDFGLN